MCGICGIFGASESFKTRKMLDAILHRGPDGHKVEDFPWGSLGFCRLDIFGSSGVNQPAISHDRQIAVVFNGEIYNFDDLKASLSFKENITDEAELILALFSEYGEGCFNKLKGMFAIAIMTPERLILARDAVGIKPLVYYTHGPRLYFASEIKALLSVIDDILEIDEDALAETAVFGFICDLEKTMIKGISQIRPGTYLTYERGKIQKKQFSELEPAFYGAADHISDGAFIENFTRLMDSAAQSFLNHSKHPQAIYLSGGVDSSLMTLFLQKNSSNTLHTFTLFDDENSEDRLFAYKVAAELGTKQNEFKTDINECLGFIDHYLYHYESLVTDGVFNVLGSLAFHILSSQISKTHKVAYCGEGADELFGGYYWMHTHPLGFGDRVRARSAKINNGKTNIHDFIMTHFPADDSKEDMSRRTIFDFLMRPGLTNCHLWSVDRSSSAFSFEARPLYLYDDLRKWALSLPIQAKVNGTQTKIILKKYLGICGSPVLSDVSTRKKVGMPSALKLSLNKLIQLSEIDLLKKRNTSELPHAAYRSFFGTVFERLLFDKFYSIFILNKGKLKDMEQEEASWKLEQA